MLVDFKALKLALQDHIERYDHAMAVNSGDPFLGALQAQYPPEALVVFDEEPTTEAIARSIFEFTELVLASGFASGAYCIPAGSVRLERVRVGETPNSWAEYGE